MDTPTRDQLAEQYLGQLPYPPYPVQEDALLAWFTSEQGVLVCAPTGTGKTLIAQAALFEALHTGTTAYYTTPLIALTEQKFREMQALGRPLGLSAPKTSASSPAIAASIPTPACWSSSPRSCSIACCIPAAFDFANVSAVVMDEFHSFADPGARHRLGTVARAVAEARSPAAALGDGRQLDRIPRTGSIAAISASSNWSRARNARCR